MFVYIYRVILGIKFKFKYEINLCFYIVYIFLYSTKVIYMIFYIFIYEMNFNGEGFFILFVKDGLGWVSLDVVFFFWGCFICVWFVEFVFLLFYCIIMCLYGFCL